MTNQLTSNAEALRLFFTEDIYLVEDKQQIAFVKPVSSTADKASQKNETIHVLERSIVETVIGQQIPAQAPISTAKKEWDFEFLGKNQKKILILVNDHNNKVSSLQGTELLRKLVKAIELTNNDFALVNYALYQTATFADLKAFFSCQLVLSFGVEFEPIGLSPKPLHILFEEDNVRMVFTKNLHDLDSDQMSKKILWTTLQQLK